MLHSIFRTLGLMCFFFATPVVSQFGVPKGRKGASFEELNRRAKEQLSGGSGNMVKMEDLANLNMEDMQKMIVESMKDPAMMDAMNGISANVEQAMEQISKMSPEQLMNQMAEGLQMLTTPDIMETVLSQKEEVLATLVEQGLVDDDTLAEYKRNPAKFEQDMKHAFGQMKEIFSDPEALSAATQMMKGLTDVLSNPEQAMQQIASVLANNDLDDDDKIEEARLQLLENPNRAGNPTLAAMFEDEDMKNIMKDPKKWREQVRKGQEVLLSGGGGGARGAGIGEL